MGTLIAICFSFVAYRMARRAGRSPWLWVGMVWLLGTASAAVFALAGWIIDGVVASDEDLDSGTVEPYLMIWAGAAGTVVGGGIACLLAGRPQPPAQPVIEAEIVGAPPKA